MISDLNDDMRSLSATGRYRADRIGLSTDTKPDDLGNGSAFVEIDTGKVFFYDEEGDEWKEV